MINTELISQVPLANLIIISIVVGLGGLILLSISKKRNNQNW